jgi:hypothetical protein
MRKVFAVIAVADTHTLNASDVVGKASLTSAIQILLASASTSQPIAASGCRRFEVRAGSEECAQSLRRGSPLLAL